jgi:hypothetical protein
MLVMHQRCHAAVEVTIVEADDHQQSPKNTGDDGLP